jgi:hypothetical protein
VFVSSSSFPLVFYSVYSVTDASAWEGLSLFCFAAGRDGVAVSEVVLPPSETSFRASFSSSVMEVLVGFL